MENISLATLTVSTKDEFDAKFSPGKRLVYSKGQILILICEYSLSFTPERLRALRNRIGKIDEALKDHDSIYADHLGSGMYVSVDAKYGSVDIRQHWFCEKRCTITPSQNGIIFSISEWTSFKQKLNELLSIHLELVDAEECMHSLQEQAMDCSECVPFWLL